MRWQMHLLHTLQKRYTTTLLTHTWHLEPGRTNGRDTLQTRRRHLLLVLGRCLLLVRPCPPIVQLKRLARGAARVGGIASGRSRRTMRRRVRRGQLRRVRRRASCVERRRPSAHGGVRWRQAMRRSPTAVWAIVGAGRCSMKRTWRRLVVLHMATCHCHSACVARLRR